MEITEKEEDEKGVEGKVGWLVSWCLEPSQPQRITSGLWQVRKRERKKKKTVTGTEEDRYEK